jgi:hypothetical protein
MFKNRMKAITGPGVHVVMVVAFALLGACGAPSDVASEVSSESMATECTTTATPISAGASTSPVKNTFPPLCGSCSDFACQTRSVGAQCGGGAQCWDNIRTCRNDGLALCRCTTNP